MRQQKEEMERFNTDDSHEYLMAAQKMAWAEINILGFTRVDNGVLVQFEFPYRTGYTDRPRIWVKSAAMVRGDNPRYMVGVFNYLYATVQRLREILESNSGD